MCTCHAAASTSSGPGGWFSPVYPRDDTVSAAHMQRAPTALGDLDLTCRPEAWLMAEEATGCL